MYQAIDYAGAPQFDGKKVSVFLEVEGAGDFFPPIQEI